MSRTQKVTVVVSGDPRELAPTCLHLARLGVEFSFKMWEIKAKFDTLQQAEKFARSVQDSPGLYATVKH